TTAGRELYNPPAAPRCGSTAGFRARRRYRQASARGDASAACEPGTHPGAAERAGAAAECAGDAGWRGDEAAAGSAGGKERRDRDSADDAGQGDVCEAAGALTAQTQALLKIRSEPNGP